MGAIGFKTGQTKSLKIGGCQIALTNRKAAI
jgi:hypothetical protein